MPSFSVVIPAYNAARTVARALDSCLAQRHLPHEVVVVDDCSTDGTVAVLEQYLQGREFPFPVRVERLERNAGPSAARNLGWERASGDYVAFLDADDLWLPGKLETVARILSSHPEIDLLGHGHALMGRGHTPSGDDAGTVRQVGYYRLLLRNFAATPCVVARRSVAERFDPRMRHTEDHELWLRISERHRVYRSPAVLTLLDRLPTSPGGASGNRVKMRVVEFFMYLCAARRRREIFPLLPLLLAFLVGKHLFGMRRSLGGRYHVS